MTLTAVIGLGTMGGRIADSVAEGGHEVRGFDPSEGAREAASASGLSVYETAEEALQGAELVVLSVPRPEHVLASARGALSTAGGAVVVDMSTIDPGTAQDASTILAKHDVTYVDAPVLGRPDKIGNWTLPAGGTEVATALVRSVLEGTVAKQVIHVGDVGAGHAVKVLNNLMFGAINAITAEVLTTCEAAGVDPEVFVSTIADSGAATVSNLFREIAPKMIASDFEPAFALGLLAKDNKLAIDLARSVSAPTHLAEIIDSVNTAAMEQGLADRDTGAVQALYHSQSAAVR
ncbi:3-hydroxyisobutyrate dehydrogenase [Saccharopolyspora lacisalsi]|uniref:3-hydroxyisobutyrate dehydrogenase n=1 Tax=Halosaccharopolyspora lacisalsi TaxID=1000566 RepID=A0A839DQW4_9PSEU|nr:NAD(P)-dependent oxidoreductase [Halosaccharopolyspora lacisalsi]MBA8823904.1 3-hydroxyisobutyrate dehydrogenase [Halosaccharopolyspora lacisalsi]